MMHTCMLQVCFCVNDVSNVIKYVYVLFDARNGPFLEIYGTLLIACFVAFGG